jgi:hypothetical protein
MTTKHHFVYGVNTPWHMARFMFWHRKTPCGVCGKTKQRRHCHFVICRHKSHLFGCPTSIPGRRVETAAKVSSRAIGPTISPFRQPVYRMYLRCGGMENERARTRPALARRRSGMQILDNSLGPRMHMQLFVDVANVAVQCSLADGQCVDNFLVAKALGQLLQDIPFPRG